MNVEYAPSPPVDEGRTQQAHEPGEADDFDRGGDEARLERRLERRLAAIGSKVDRLGGDAKLARQDKACRGRVSDRTSTISAEKSGNRAASIRARMLEPRPEMRTAVRTRAVTVSACRG